MKTCLEKAEEAAVSAAAANDAVALQQLQRVLDHLNTALRLHQEMPIENDRRAAQEYRAGLRCWSRYTSTSA